MESKFTKEEQRKYLFKKHIKDHLFEYILDFMGPIIVVIFILYLCDAEFNSYLCGILVVICYSLGKIAYNIWHY